MRILVAIGSPDAQNARGELLDMEAELQRILDATDKPRRAGKAAVHILEQGGTAAIHDALTTGRYHVLHISCHAAPGTLILETADGAEDRVTAQRLCDEAIPAGRAAPLVVLAGCSTGQDGKTADDADAAELPGLARTLVRRGVPAVIAMQAAVGDHYATDLMGEVYRGAVHLAGTPPAGGARPCPPHHRAKADHADASAIASRRRNGRRRPSSAPHRPRPCSTRPRNPRRWRKSRPRPSIPASWSAGSATWSAAGASSG